MTEGVVEVQIDDQEFEIHVRRLPQTRGWSRKDLNLDSSAAPLHGEGRGANPHYLYIRACSSVAEQLLFSIV
jgi:hypothetical protein